MGIFDLLFILVFLAAVATLLSAASFAIRGKGGRALAILRKLGICAAAYFAVIVTTSLFWPRTVLHVGEPQCFDDWCIAVQSATAGRHFTVALRLFSTARRVSQREWNVVVYLCDRQGHRYDPVPNPSDVPFDVQLGPGESVTATRLFDLPAGASDPGLVITHEGGFPIGWFIIGYETWFHKPAIVRLP
jgi:hypothetical protein